MKKIIKLICIVLLFSMIVPMLLTVNAAEGNGRSDERTGIEMRRVKTGTAKHTEGYYTSDKKLDKIPVTYEAWVYIPSEVHSTASGVILGTQYDFWDNSWEGNSYSNGIHFSFGIRAGGHPCLVYGKTGQKRVWEFDDEKVIIPADKWTHVTICHDTSEGNNLVWCMIDGDEKKVQKSGTNNFIKLNNSIFDSHLCLAGDNFRANSNSLNGIILSDVAVYADIRTYAEVKSDYQNGADTNDKDLILCYQISSENQNKDVRDASGNGYDMNYYRMFLNEAEMNEIRKQDKHEYAYSIAVLPDYQYVSGRYPQKLNTIFKYLVDNKESKNIQYVITVGDMTDNDTDGEWTGVKTQYAILDKAGIPYTVVRGNHDGDGTKFNKIFGKGTQYYNHVKENGGFYHEGSAANTYVLFDTEEVKYLILNLDWGITNERVFMWADKIIEAHPDRRVIVTLHSYLNSDGTLLENGDWAAPSGYNAANINPTRMWKEHFSKYSNIDMIIGGHMHSDNILVTPAVGADGNIVQQLLINSQFSELGTSSGGLGALGLIAFMYFTEDGTHAKIEYYSTTYRRYYYEKNTEISLDFGAATVDIGGEVSLDGREVEAEEFGFTLRWANKDFYLLDGIDPIKTTNKADGSFVFENIKVNNAGTYYFIISQDITNKEEHITFDASIYHVKVKVVDDGNGGFKVAEASIVKEGSTDAQEALVFANAYMGSVKQNMLWIWITAGALFGVGVIAGALVVIIKKKRVKKA